MIKSVGNTRTQMCFMPCPPGTFCTCEQQDKNREYMNKQVPFVDEVQQFNEMMGKEEEQLKCFHFSNLQTTF